MRVANRIAGRFWRMLGAAATLDAERGPGGPGSVRDGLILASVGLEDPEDLG